MRKLMALLAVVALAAWVPACSAQDTKKDAPKAATTAAPAPAPAPAAAAAGDLKTPKDKLSYAIGMQIGRSLRESQVDVDMAVLAKAMQDALVGAKLQLTDDEYQQVMMSFQKEAMDKAEARSKELGEKNKKLGVEFLAKNAKAEGVKTTTSGLQYKVTKEGTGPAPKPNDTVKVMYVGKLIDGKQFGSSNNEAVELPLGEEGIPPGLKEGILLMKVGGATTLWIPGELAGTEFVPPGGTVEPFSTLVFEVTLTEIAKPEAPAVAPAPATPPTPTTTVAPAKPAPTTTVAPAKPAPTTTIAPAKPAPATPAK